MSVLRDPEAAHARRQQDWECGREGAPCRFGPEASGRCSARPECRPENQGDRWECARPLDAGGPCEKGPLPNGECCFPPTPCLPRATLPRRLRTTWRLAALSAVGVSLLMLSTLGGVSPGPLTAPHAAFEEDCGKCHANVADPSLGWISRVASAGLFHPERHLANSEKCLVCHAFDSALAVHGIQSVDRTADGLTASAARIVWSDARRPSAEVCLAAALLPDRDRGQQAGGSQPQSPIACMVCHRDHRGRAFASTAMTDSQCQVCHADAFDGFSGHPPLDGYPYRSTLQASFNHRTHFGSHFLTVAQEGIRPPANCIACHDTNEQGEMSVGGVPTCLACHESDIIDSLGQSAQADFLALSKLVLDDGASQGSPARTEPHRHLKRFSHLSHRQAVADHGCVFCHKLAATDYVAQGAAGFSPMPHEICATCHQEPAGLARCVTCHEYHFVHADEWLMREGGDLRSSPSSNE